MNLTLCRTRQFVTQLCMLSAMKTLLFNVEFTGTNKFQLKGKYHCDVYCILTSSMVKKTFQLDI